MYPTIPGLLHSLAHSALLATIGVNPDLLQFYVSKSGDHFTYMTGTYQHYYVTGIITTFGAHENHSFLGLALPAHHPLSKRVYYQLCDDCFQTPSRLKAACACDATTLAAYAYAVEVEPLVPHPHSLACACSSAR